MTRKQAEDIRWVAAEVAHLAVLLQSHGLGHLANRLHSVQQELQYAPRNKPTSPDMGYRSGEIIVLENYRRRSVNPSATRA
jgi:hypothetical protein